MQDEKRFRAKVSDFGLSAHMAADQKCVEISHGTEAYLPLEVFQDLVVTEASDIYALGLVIWEIYYGIFWFSVWDAEKKRRKCAPLGHESCTLRLQFRAGRMFSSSSSHDFTSLSKVFH
jgi:serine/threonine protein kinase